MEPLLAILAGGASTRMGRDKAFLEAGGETLLARLAGLGRGLGLGLLVVGRDRPAGWTADDVRFVPDEQPGQGPLGGVAAALACAPAIVAVACDMPALDAPALRWLLDQAAAHPLVDGLATVTPAGLEPLFSVYTARCLPAARQRLRDGQRALHHLIEAGDFVRAPAPGWLVPRLANVNTPDDWKRQQEKD
jgi:molybdopterin-guanine dinucleotide biosynthesis protein A